MNTVCAYEQVSFFAEGFSRGVCEVCNDLIIDVLISYQGCIADHRRIAEALADSGQQF
jgi:hypothetical protein